MKIYGYYSEKKTPLLLQPYFMAILFGLLLALGVLGLGYGIRFIVISIITYWTIAAAILIVLIILYVFRRRRKRKESFMMRSRHGN